MPIKFYHTPKVIFQGANRDETQPAGPCWSLRWCSSEGNTANTKYLRKLNWSPSHWTGTSRVWHSTNLLQPSNHVRLLLLKSSTMSPFSGAVQCCCRPNELAWYFRSPLYRSPQGLRFCWKELCKQMKMDWWKSLKIWDHALLSVVLWLGKIT